MWQKILKFFWFLGQSQWPVSMHYFQNKLLTEHQWTSTMKQPPQCMSFTLTFPRLGKAFNYCKMIGSHVRWWNNLVLSGDFISFHRVGNNARRVSPWWNYFILSPLRFMQKSVALLTWRSNKCAWHPGETPLGLTLGWTKQGLRKDLRGIHEGLERN